MSANADMKWMLVTVHDNGSVFCQRTATLVRLFCRGTLTLARLNVRSWSMCSAGLRVESGVYEDAALGYVT